MLPPASALQKKAVLATSGSLTIEKTERASRVRRRRAGFRKKAGPSSFCPIVEKYDDANTVWENSLPEGTRVCDAQLDEGKGVGTLSSTSATTHFNASPRARRSRFSRKNSVVRSNDAST